MQTTVYNIFTALNLSSIAKSRFIVGDSPYTTVLASASLNTWQQVVGVRDGNTLFLYVNGVILSTSAGISQSQLLNNQYIGAGNNNSFFSYFTGFIDDVRIYNRALSAQEVSDLFRAGTLIRNAKIRNARFNQ